MEVCRIFTSLRAVPWYAHVQRSQSLIVSIEGRHTAENIGRFFDENLKAYKVRDKTEALVTDNDSKFVAAVRDYVGVLNPTCAGHNLNLAIRAHGLDEVHVLFGLLVHYLMPD